MQCLCVPNTVMLHRVLLEEKISYPMYSPHYTKPEVLLFVHKSLRIVHILSQSHSVRTILQFTIMNSKWSLSFSFLHTKPACISLLLLTCQKTPSPLPPSHPLWFDHTNICSELQCMHRLFMRFALLACYCSLLCPDTFPAHCLEHLRIYSFTVRNQVLRPYKTTGKITVLNILILLFFVSRWVADIPNI
jgi:hypothetical protein